MKTWVESHQVLSLLLFSALAFAVWEVYPALIVLFAGYLIAAGLAPLVAFLSCVMPRVLALLLSYLFLAVVLAGICAGIAIPLAIQAQQFAAQFQMDMQGNGPLTFLGASGLDLQSIALYLQSHIATIASTTISIITSGIAAFVVSIYFLYDWHALVGTPGTAHGLWRVFGEGVRDASVVLGRWVRGQLLLCACIGSMVLIGMYLYGVPFAPVLGALAFIMEFIPYVGPVLAAVPAVLFGLHVSLTNALVIAGIYLAIHQIENHLLVPIIMHKSVYMHPIAVITIMFAGFVVLGIAGIILSVPFAAFIRIVAPRVWKG